MMNHLRNTKCHCGSGKKYKKCHYIIEHEQREQKIIADRRRIVGLSADENRERQRNTDIALGILGIARLNRNAP